MNLILKGFTALVSGGSYGIGREIALALAAEGADLIICGRQEGPLEKTKSELEKAGVRVEASCVDATKPESVKACFDSVVRKTGRLDILVNNVGGAEKFGSFFDLTDDDWERAYALNFMSMVYFTREAIPFLRKSRRASVLNVSSVPAHQPGRFNPHYSAAKAAMVNLSKHLSNLLAPENILVNTVCPGTLDGGGWERNLKDKAERLGISFAEAEERMREEENKKVPLNRIGSPKDIAAMVTFLASDQARFITGECINIDGGVTRSVL